MLTINYFSVMNKIKQLESKKLLKELEFIQSDYNYRLEIVNEADTEFIKSLNSFLETRPVLKDLFDKKINARLNDIFKQKKQEVDKIQSESESYEFETKSDELIETKNSKLKKLYREIVKLTHPDKISSHKLNEIYIKATKAYNQNDIIETYCLCVELNIDFEIDESERVKINEKIDELKNRIVFMETTLTWKWFKSEEIEKERILVEYLNRRLNN